MPTKIISWIHMGNTMENSPHISFDWENTMKTHARKIKNKKHPDCKGSSLSSNVVQIPCKIRLPLFCLWKHRVKWDVSTYVAYHRNVSVLYSKGDLQLYPPNPYQVNHNFVSAQNGQVFSIRSDAQFHITMLHVKMLVSLWRNAHFSHVSSSTPIIYRRT